MTLQANTPIIRYNYTGAGDYTFDFRVFESSDLLLTYTSTGGVETTLVLDTDYTVSLETLPAVGGTCSLTYSESDGTIDIQRNMEFVQETDFVNNSALDMETLEKCFDRAMMLIQQMNVVIENEAIVQGWTGNWATTTIYQAGDIVYESSNKHYYSCFEAHTSGTFSTDLAAGKWLKFLDTTAIQTIQTDCETAQTAAELAETNAETAQTAAELAETNAETAETNAETAESNATAYALEAYHWAEYPEDSLVPEGDLSTEYSAYHWAQKAQAAAAGVSMPSINPGDAYKRLRANSGETAFELESRSYGGIKELGNGNMTLTDTPLLVEFDANFPYAGGITPDASNDKITADIDGDFEAVVYFGGTVSSKKHIVVEIYKNNVATGLIGEQCVGEDNKGISLSFNVPISLVATDYLTLKANITASSLSLSDGTFYFWLKDLQLS